MKAKTEEILIIGIAFALLIATVFITDPNIFGYVVYSPENYTYEPSLIEYNNGYKLIKQNLSNLEITSLNPSNYETAFLKVNDKYYIDRGYKIETIPEDLQNLLWIKTANNDKNTQNLNFNFNVNYPVRIYIGYDKRLEPPSWLSSWNYYGTGIETKDESSNPYNIYYKNFQQGNIQLGDNCETDCTSGSKSMYLVLIDTTYPSSASLISEEIQPENLSKWDLLEKQETLNSQTIDYYYSVDSGSTWNLIENFNLSYINSTKLQIKITLNSDGTSTPILHNLTLNYIKQKIICIENWTCTNWSACINNTQYRNCTDLNNCNTTLNKPLEIQNCTLENNCTENWNCTSWSSCINNTQTRICNDLNNCNTTLNKPLETQNCTSEENPEGSGGSSSGGGGSSAPNTVYQSSVKIPVTIKTKPLETKKQQKTIPLYESQEPKQESPITGSIVIEKKPKRYFINIILFSIFVVVCYLFYKKLIREK